ncbi:type III-A CRISPR-associated RAMP protein Csm3 [bacterium]|mgnify:CR=1 FL=1|nr:MAG: type III-A CRISPR-associated RAMP protein Csm3 [bacterium]
MRAQIKKKVFIEGKIVAKTGLAIGGTDVGLEIGGTDKIVIRHPITKEPYVPGSSLRGKMRSLLERVHQGDNITKQGKAMVHICKPDKVSSPCPICTVFGLPAESAEKFHENNPDMVFVTRLIVRDGACSEEWIKTATDTELPYTETKTEAVIDRITSEATPRTFERVPAGAEFALDLVLTLYEGDDENEFINLIFQGLKLLQDDYLGGSGSRGYGKVKINIEQIYERTAEDYREARERHKYEIDIPSELTNNGE